MVAGERALGRGPPRTKRRRGGVVCCSRWCDVTVTTTTDDDVGLLPVGSVPSPTNTPKHGLAFPIAPRTANHDPIPPKSITYSQIQALGTPISNPPLIQSRRETRYVAAPPSSGMPPTSAHPPFFVVRRTLLLLLLLLAAAAVSSSAAGATEVALQTKHDPASIFSILHYLE